VLTDNASPDDVMGHRIFDFHRITAACRGQKGARYRHFGFTRATMAMGECSQGGRAGGEVICGFFPYNIRPFTPPSDNLYFRFLRRIAPGLPGVGNRPRWPTRAACLIVPIQLLSCSAEFRSLTCFRMAKREKSEGLRKRSADVDCGFCGHRQKIRIVKT